jgi:hypothetical protein
MTTSSKKEFRGVWLEDYIISEKGLSWTEKLVFEIIAQYDDSDLWCDFSNEQFAKILNCSQREIARAISKLKKTMYVTEIELNGRKLSCKKF